MDGKSVPYEKDLDLAEGPGIGDWGEWGDWGDRAQCIDEKCEMGAKSKGEAEDFENAELNRRIASLLKQPRMIEFMKRLKAMEETVR